MNNNFGVCLASKSVTFFNQLFLKRKVILNYAIVHNGSVVIAARMRMRIVVCNTTMCSPAGVADPYKAFHFSKVKAALDLTYLTYTFSYGNLIIRRKSRYAYAV